MKPAALLMLSGACLLLASASQARASVEAGEGGASFDFANFADKAQTLMNQFTEQPADVPQDTAAANVSAFLVMIQHAEGTAGQVNPYAVCFGYGHTVQDFSDHPAITGEWAGERLPDAMCRNAGFGPGCVSTAAGAYQIIKPTWRALGMPDFSPVSQNAAAVELIRRRGALEDVRAGRIEAAISKCKNEWASLPGNYAKQGQRGIDALVAWYQQNGGQTA